jgi:hypothetical protein
MKVPPKNGISIGHFAIRTSLAIGMSAYHRLLALAGIPLCSMVQMTKASLLNSPDMNKSGKSTSMFLASRDWLWKGDALYPAGQGNDDFLHGR